MGVHFDPEGFVFEPLAHSSPLWTAGSSSLPNDWPLTCGLCRWPPARGYPPGRVGGHDSRSSPRRSAREAGCPPTTRLGGGNPLRFHPKTHRGSSDDRACERVPAWRQSPSSGAGADDAQRTPACRCAGDSPRRSHCGRRWRGLIHVASRSRADAAQAGRAGACHPDPAGIPWSHGEASNDESQLLERRSLPVVPLHRKRLVPVRESCGPVCAGAVSNDGGGNADARQ